MKALNEIKVLDLSKMLPGNYCSMLLADYGAQVIKVEQPQRIDPVRYFQPQKNGLSYWHMALNRNKRSLTLDYLSPEGKEIFLELVKTADVLLHSSRPVFMKKHGLSWEELEKVNPRLVYAALTGFGSSAANSEKAAHDINILGLCGANISPRLPEPSLGSIQVSGLSGAMHGSFAILAALLARGHTGKGQYVDISMMRSTLSLLTVDFSNISGFKDTGTPIHPRQSPNYTFYKTKDSKYMTVGTFEEKFWNRMCDILYLPEAKEKIKDPSCRDELFEFLNNAFSKKTRDEWVAIFDNENICVTGVYELSEAMQNGIFAENDMLTVLDDEHTGKTEYIAPPVGLSDTPAVIECRAPFLGEHNDPILSGLGIKSEKILELKEKGII